ncbi:Glycosyltransferase [Granulibacter bethesdensis]|uniref:UPF0229 protein GbCGDNIH3_0508 n=1 Tax=Granulibacter bethesdensis TaxID=364410 RepID=A0AAN0VF83_9PROT|nr:YeaH/YhbH family protein [Granulibacter bethesdensis]AHJ62280.1 Glycosyltransferase [Granulibacter bethesdensis]
MNIVDRRLNPRGKSLANRQRFIRKARRQIMEAVRDAAARQGIRETGVGEGIRINTDALREPTLHHASGTGNRTHVLPGNKEFVEGDQIRRQGGGGRGKGREGAPDGEGEDAFTFALSQDEFLDLFLEDLELPDLLRRQLRSAEEATPRRAGYAISGSATNVNLVRTMRNSLSRRIALGRPRLEETEAEERELASLLENGTDPERQAELRHRIEQARSRGRRIPFIDPIDIRYNRYQSVPRPAASAVMFCLMDVSGSMTEHMKDLAKRFYKLLYLFLSRRYKHVDIVFIRHTHVAKEVDEEAFFTSTESGGTVVSTALEKMLAIMKDRYAKEDWNIYAAQASDGDNLPSDNNHACALLTREILPQCQYFAYLEVGAENMPGGDTELWRAYKTVAESDQPLAMRHVSHRGQIYPVFRQLFTRDKATRDSINEVEA